MTPVAGKWAQSRSDVLGGSEGPNSLSHFLEDDDGGRPCLLAPLRAPESLSRPLLGIPFATPASHIQGKNMYKNMTPKLPSRVCLVLKHLWSYFVQMFVHIFALCMWGAGVTKVFLAFAPEKTMQLFCLQLEASCLQLSFFLLAVVFGSFFENNFDHPHPRYLQRNMPAKYAIQWGSIWHQSRWKVKGFLQRIWHMDPPKYGIRTPLVCHMNRGGGGLQFVAFLLSLFLSVSTLNSSVFAYSWASLLTVGNVS